MVYNCTPICKFAFKTKARDAPRNEKTRGLKVRRYAAPLIDLHDYLAFFHGDTLSNKIDVTEFNEIILNIIPNSWYKQAYVQGFGCESILFKKSINMFE